jgi:UDP-N-acetylmuramoyl-tripeptide--D-alanyl-D-alanine ligase
MRALWAAIPPEHRGAYGATSAELAPELLSRLHSGDVVLVKGSLGSRMAVIVDALKNREPAPA